MTFLRLITAALALSMSALSANATVILSFDTSASDIQVGDTFTVDLNFSNSDTSIVAEHLNLWSLALDFDSNLLSLDGFSIGGSFSQIVGLSGRVDGFPSPPTFLWPTVSGADILLARLTFTAINAGTDSISTSSEMFQNGSLSFINDIDSASLQLDIAEVSEPATLGLFAMAGFLMLWRRRTSVV